MATSTFYYLDGEMEGIPYAEGGIKKILTGRPLKWLNFNINPNLKKQAQIEVEVEIEVEFL